MAQDKAEVFEYKVGDGRCVKYTDANGVDHTDVPPGLKNPIAVVQWLEAQGKRTKRINPRRP